MFIYLVYGCFCITKVELSRDVANSTFAKLKLFYLALDRKSLWTSDLECYYHLSSYTILAQISLVLVTAPFLYFHNIIYLLCYNSYHTELRSLIICPLNYKLLKGMDSILPQISLCSIFGLSFNKYILSGCVLGMSEDNQSSLSLFMKLILVEETGQ